MSRVDIIDKLYASKKKSALEFNYDNLRAPYINMLFTPQDIQELYRIATSIKLNGKIEEKYRLIDAVMNRRGFKFYIRGTNRAVYRFLEDPSFVAKVALDKVGLGDSAAEYKNQEFLKPFCCKIFEVDPTGVIAFVERVNPITSLEEFLSVADDIFNMMVTKIIGKYIMDDVGTTKFMNYGIRIRSDGCAFGPVLIDFPYAYEIDGSKLICRRPINTSEGAVTCGGNIDYDDGMNTLRCEKCGRIYTAKELRKDDSYVIKMYGDGDEAYQVRVRIVDADGNIIIDSGRKSNRYLTPEEIRRINMYSESNAREIEVVQTINRKSKKRSMEQIREEQFYEDMRRMREETNRAYQEAEPFNPVIRKPKTNEVIVESTSKADKEPNKSWLKAEEPSDFYYNPKHEVIDVIMDDKPEEYGDCDDHAVDYEDQIINDSHDEVDVVDENEDQAEAEQETKEVLEGLLSGIGYAIEPVERMLQNIDKKHDDKPDVLIPADQPTTFKRKTIDQYIKFKRVESDDQAEAPDATEIAPEIKNGIDEDQYDFQHELAKAIMDGISQSKEEQPDFSDYEPEESEAALSEDEDADSEEDDIDESHVKKIRKIKVRRYGDEDMSDY